MSALSTRALFFPLKAMYYSDIGSDYKIIGSVFEKPVRLLTIQNLTDALLLFSQYPDNRENNIAIDAKSFYTFDFGANRSDVGGNFAIPKGFGIYVKKCDDTNILPAPENPTEGSVVVTAVFGE